MLKPRQQSPSRKNPKHLKEFCHPGDSSYEEEEEEEDDGEKEESEEENEEMGTGDAGRKDQEKKTPDNKGMNHTLPCNHCGY